MFMRQLSTKIQMKWIISNHTAFKDEKTTYRIADYKWPHHENYVTIQS